MTQLVNNFYANTSLVISIIVVIRNFRSEYFHICWKIRTDVFTIFKVRSVELENFPDSILRCNAFFVVYGCLSHMEQ